MCGHVQICEFILINCKEKNPANDRGETPLHLAAQEGYLSLCEVMLKFASDKSPRNDKGETPLHHAAFYSHIDVYKLLLENTKTQTLEILEVQPLFILLLLQVIW